MVGKEVNKPYDEIEQVTLEIETFIRRSLAFWKDTFRKLWLQPDKMVFWPGDFLNENEELEIYRGNGILAFALFSFPTPFIDLSTGDFKIWEVYFSYIDGRISKNRIERFCKYDLRELRDLLNEMGFTATKPRSMRNTTTIYLIGPRVAKSTPCKWREDSWVFSMNPKDVTRKICLNLSKGIRKNLKAWNENKKHDHYEDQVKLYEACLEYADDLHNFANPALSSSRHDNIKAEEIRSKLDLLCGATFIKQ